MTDTIALLLMQLSEAGEPALLWGREADPYFGPQFDHLLIAGVLRELPPDTTWEPCDGCQCGLDARPIRPVGCEFLAICPLDNAKDLRLEPIDLRTFRIEQLPLVRAIAMASGFGDRPSEIASGVFHLGRTASGRAVFVIPAVHVALGEATVLLIREAAQGGPATVILPDLEPGEVMRFTIAGMHAVPISAALAGAPPGAPFRLDAALLEPAPAKGLVLRVAAGIAELDGIRIALPHQPFRLLHALAERLRTSGEVVSGREIEELCGRDPRDLVRELRAAVSAAGVLPDEAQRLIETRRGRGWQLGIPSDTVKVEP